MRTENYPYEGMESREVLPHSNRISFVEQVEGSNSLLGKTILLGYATALRAAEDQIEDLQRKIPFAPESFGFIFHKGDNGQEYYLSADESWIMMKDAKACTYIVNKVGGKPTEIYLPSADIAKAYFLAVGYQWEPVTEVKVSFTEADEEKILTEHDNAQDDYRRIREGNDKDVLDYNKIVEDGQTAKLHGGEEQSETTNQK